MVLRDARRLQGLTQQEVIDTFGLAYDRTRLARIEAGEGFQSLDRALDALRRLGVEVFASVPTTGTASLSTTGTAPAPSDDSNDSDDSDDSDDK